MQVNNLTLGYLLKEIQKEAVGSFINKIQEVGKGIFKIKIHTNAGSKDLIVTKNSLFISNVSFPAKQNSSSFFSKLKQVLNNKKILSISQENFDRVVVIEFADFNLILEFFHKSNIILTDKENTIIIVQRREEWKDRILKKNEKFKFSSSKGENPKTISQKFLEEAFEKSSSSIIKTLISNVNIAPLVAEEILFELKIDKKLNSEEILAKDIKKIAQKISEFYSLKKPSKKPVIFKEELLPFEFSGVKNQVIQKSLFSALQDHFAREIVSKPADFAMKESQVEINRLKYSMDLQIKSKQQLENNAIECKESADLIYEYFNDLKDIANAVQTAQKKKINKKEVMYKINLALKRKSKNKLKITEINSKRKELEIEVIID